jgi:hypothetical protein
VKVDPETGEQTVVGEFNISGQPPVNDIRSLTVDDEGNIYVVDNTGDVFQVNSLTAEMSLKADSATFESVYGFAYDPLEDDIHYWSNEGRELFKFDPVAGTLTLVTSGNKYDMFENYRDIENMYELDFDQYGNAYIMNYDLTIINSVTKERTVVSGSDINLNGTYAYSESFFVMPTTPPEPDNLFVTKRFYGLTKTGWSEKSKASFARFAENNSFNEVVCSVRMKRNPNMSFSENLKIAQKLGRSACRIATTENPDIEITVKAYVVKEKPMNSVKIRLRLNLR